MDIPCMLDYYHIYWTDFCFISTTKGLNKFVKSGYGEGVKNGHFSGDMTNYERLRA